jgi:predicted transcriptional regulator of viral defense system
MKKISMKALEAAKEEIRHEFEILGQSIFTRNEIENILELNRHTWRLPGQTTTNDFLEYMKPKLKSVRFEFPARPVLRYLQRDLSVYQVALSLKENSYFCHHTAMYFHGLTEQMPKTVYLNNEQTPKPQYPMSLSQEGIERAFRGKPRVSNNIAQFRGFKICILNGKFSEGLGIVNLRVPEGEEIVPATGLERTLIDITVRPFYAGGESEVLKAFRKAKGKVSIKKLVGMLEKLDYVYPYHQAIGFYLERSGVFSDQAIKPLRDIEMRFDFYLTYRMKEMDYSEKWRLYYPKRL